MSFERVLLHNTRGQCVFFQEVYNAAFPVDLLHCVTINAVGFNICYVSTALVSDFNGLLSDFTAFLLMCCAAIGRFIMLTNMDYITAI